MKRYHKILISFIISMAAFVAAMPVFANGTKSRVIVTVDLGGSDTDGKATTSWPLPVSLSGQVTFGDIIENFAEPVDSARTKMWWFHGEEPTSEYGITADLTALRHSGVGGVVYYDQVHGDGSGADEVFSPRWWTMLRRAAHVADSLDMTFEVNASNGYVAGGPWVSPDLSMQRVGMADTLITVDSNAKMMKLPEVRLPYFEDISAVAVPADKCDYAAYDFIDKEVRIDAGCQRRVIDTDLGENKRISAVTYLVNGRGKSATSATNIPGPHASSFYGTGYIELPPLGTLEVSADGVNYSQVCSLRPRYRGHDTWGEITVAFPETEGRFFRLSLQGWQIHDKLDDVLKIYKLKLLSGPRIDDWEVKAALRSDYDHPDIEPLTESRGAIDSRRIVRLNKISQDSIDTSNLGRGSWRIMRFYHTSTGAKTKHGRKKALGLECDRLSAAAAKVQWRNYVQPIIDTLRIVDCPLWGVTMDSHEAGSQNWTRLMPRHFESQHGYDILSYLPVVCGYVVDNRAKSDSVLLDLRRTISRLIASEFYGTFNCLCGERGLHFTAQAIGNALCLTGDQQLANKFVDRPQGEFWSIHPDGSYDVKDCSSAAHVYGRQIASGEAFTDAKYSEPLSHFKRLADCAYANGVNEFVVCASAHQPWADRVPGNTAGGRQYCLNRNNPFMALSRGFWDYQARCSWLLRQGKPVVDLCVFLGDEVPMKTLSYRLPAMPHGYDFDVLTSDALKCRFGASDSGTAILPDGMEYSAIVVPSASVVKDESRRLLEDLASRGITIVYSDTVPTDAALLPDIIAPDSCVRFVHRRTSDSDVYFVYNHSDSPVADTFSFRCVRPSAVILDPMAGNAAASNRFPNGEYTDVDISLEPWQSLFVAFTDSDFSLKQATRQCGAIDVSDGWTLKISDKTLDHLGDWTIEEDSGIKHFSGIAEYSTTLSVDLKPDLRYFIKPDLLNCAARVWVNGTVCGYAWASPYKVDITDCLVDGENELRIEVANSLVNRIVGHLNGECPAEGTFSSTEFCMPDTPLVPSGMCSCSLVMENIP